MNERINAMERLNKLVSEKGPLLAGLDPDMDKIWDVTAMKMPDFCFDYIDAIKDKVAAIKINIAFFEAYYDIDLFW